MNKDNTNRHVNAEEENCNGIQYLEREIEGEFDFPKNEYHNPLFNTRCSSLKIYTHKQRSSTWEWRKEMREFEMKSYWW